METFTRTVVRLIKNIPKGKVATYGQIATMAGQPGHARQVVRILHTMTRKYQLPWHRVINAQGRISLPRPKEYEEQKARLTMEGVAFDAKDRIALGIYRWKGRI